MAGKDRVARFDQVFARSVVLRSCEAQLNALVEASVAVGEDPETAKHLALDRIKVDRDLAVSLVFAATESDAADPISAACDIVSDAIARRFA